MMTMTITMMMTSVARLWTPRSLRCNREFQGGRVFLRGKKHMKSDCAEAARHVVRSVTH